MIAQADCPHAACWQDFLDGTLSDTDQQWLTNHLEGCPRCLEVMEHLTAAGHSWPTTASCFDEDEVSTPTALWRVVQELKETGSHPEPVTESARESSDTLPLLDPPQTPEALGRLGSYDIIEVIGRGGMGVVLKALDPALNRLVAIKVLAPQWATSSAARKRFAREARATAAVRHDHVVAVYAVEEAGGLPYLVMEYVHGMSLQQRLDETGPLPVEEIVRIGMQTAAGLAAAHAQGLIHRDVKPANILLEQGFERVKLSDFGLARAMDDASVTQSGVIAGTPQYMAPEQARGTTLDHRADLFSLGSVLYAACTGRPPFRAPTTLAVLRRVSEETPRDIQELNPEVPVWLVEIIEILHAKDPADRFQSAAELSRLLERCLAHLQNPRLMRLPAQLRPRASGLGRRWRHSILAALFLCVLVGAGMWGILCVGRPDGSNNEGDGSTPGGNPALRGKNKPWVVLTSGTTVRQRPGSRLLFQVHYRFQQGSPEGVWNLRWVVQCAGQTVHEQLLLPGTLNSEGTLQATTTRPGLLLRGPVESFLVVEKLVPGKIGWQQELISNVLELSSPQGMLPFGP
jgi:serine/threonine-protein kinase